MAQMIKEIKETYDGSMVMEAKTIEPLIFKLAVTETKYTNLILGNFNKGWFEDSVFGSMTDLIVNKYYKQKSKLPNIDTVKLLVEKYYADPKNKTDKDQALRKITSALDSDPHKFDEYILDNEILNYLKRVGQFYVITSSIDDMTKNNIGKCIEQLNGINNISFFTDNGFNYFDQFEQHKAELLNPLAKLSTGYSHLDKYTAGGYNKEGKNLILFMAEAGLGKSMMLSNTATRMLRKGKFVVIISLEMSEFVYLKRIDGQVSNLDINTLDKNISALEDSVNELKFKSPDALLQVKEFPPNTVNCIQIKTYIESLIRQYKRNPDCIIIDYLGLVAPNNGVSGMNSYERLGNVSKDMRALSYIFACPVLSAIQTNRSGYNTTETGLEHVGESMGIAHDADFIGCLFRDENDKQQGIMRMRILKNRLGGMQGSVLNFNVNYFTQTLWEEDEYIPVEKDIDKFTKDLSDNLDALN